MAAATTPARVRRHLIDLVEDYPQLADFCRAQLDELTDACLQALPRTALAVITPDGLAQGVHQRFLQDHGSHVVAFRLRALTQPLAERLYQDGLITDSPLRHITS